MSGKNILKETWEILKAAIKNLKRDEPIIYSAAIAFFTIFSLPAIILVMVLVGTIFLDQSTISEEILDQIQTTIGPKAAEQVNVVMGNVLKTPSSFWYMFIAIIVVMKSGTMIFFIVQKALNSIWKVTVKKEVKYFRLLKYRSITLLVVIGLGLLLVLSLLLDTALIFLIEQLEVIFGNYTSYLIRGANLLLNFVVELLFFTCILKLLPDAVLSWKDVFVGGLITTILFMIGKQVINLILGSIEVADYYAGAGSLVIILLWIFYSSIILFLGGEFTKAYANHHGYELKPKSIAVIYSKDTN